MVSETRIKHGPNSFTFELKCQELQPFYMPAKRVDFSPDYSTEIHPKDEDIMQVVRTKYRIWSLARSDLSETQPQSILNHQTRQCQLGEKPTQFYQEESRVPPSSSVTMTQFDTVDTALNNLYGILLDQAKLPMTCDEGVCHIAREIQLICPEEFKAIVLCMGSYHMATVVLDCLGKYLSTGCKSVHLKLWATHGRNLLQCGSSSIMKLIQIIKWG